MAIATIVFMPGVHEIEGAFKKYGPYITSIVSKPKGHTVIMKELEDRSLYHLYCFKTKSLQCHYVKKHCVFWDLRLYSDPINWVRGAIGVM